MWKYEEVYKEINVTNTEAYKEDCELECDDELYQKKYNQYYHHTQFYNEKVYQFMKIFNNTLNYVKNVTFFDNIKIVNTLLFEHIQHFDEFYKEIKKVKEIAYIPSDIKKEKNM